MRKLVGAVGIEPTTSIQAKRFSSEWITSDLPRIARNFKIGEIAFRAGPYKQGHRALRMAKLHIFDDQTRLRCPMGE
jgi:hypothetical protein